MADAVRNESSRNAEQTEIEIGGIPLRDNSSARPLYRDATRAACLGLLLNLGLGVVKLVGGIVGQSFALVADAINSLGDSLTSVAVLFALWYAQRPADAEHPYGHTRAESVAASNVALLIIISALFIGWEAVRRFSVPHALPPMWTLWIAGTNAVIKESLYRYKLKVGRRVGSTAIIANAWDHRSDALSSMAVLIGLGIVRYAGPKYIWADEVAALIVVAAILWSGTRLLLQSSSELMDAQADDEFVQQIRQAAESVDGVRVVEKLWVRKTGLEYLADLHVEVDKSLTVEQGHMIGHRVKDHLVAKFARLRDVLVHLEPYPHVHEKNFNG